MISNYFTASGVGIYYYRARYYNPRSGRFLSEDPIGFAGGDYNLYRYVFNNPAKYRDPQGLAGIGTAFDAGGGVLAETSGGAVGSIIGGAIGASVGNLPGAIVGGLAGEYIGDLISGPTGDPYSDNPNHPKFTPIPVDPGPFRSSIPPLKPIKYPSNTCSAK